MAGNCSQENCHPEETGCNSEGCFVLTECQYYKSKEETVAKFDNYEDDFYVRIPWTGNTLGLQDLDFISSTSQIILIGVAGVASAGKSTFLATLYCLLRHGYSIGHYKFAGSLTLIGWEDIAWYLSWNTHNDVQFPPHTSSNAGRIPGLLHISLRNERGEKKELVFTDAPGEWYRNWVVNKNDVNSAGAQWIHENADAFLLFADCEMLSGSQLGKARQQIKQVADRLKDGLNERPICLIWSKSDIKIDEDIESQISRHINNSEIQNYIEFKTSVRNDENTDLQINILNSINWLIQILSNETNQIPIPERFEENDLFLSKREK
ncbi:MULTISPECIES: TRAFAC clade GTPase domain-containing protein [Sphingobacterium]|uniref:TRAFAC clade GTPase domain-containing protein n=1 Tax=Sphingobacterium TaxID=28453 RepID=UPI000DB361B4|nr:MULTISPECIES: hypothetical protein [Sphingobacterium]PZU02139.1 MAG: hypothetical protein DI622_21235 [Chryseobacterium sp.]